MKHRIIFVDDSDTIRKFVAMGLRLKNYVIDLASDGQEALEKIAVNKVELVITDLNMPNMDGFELITNLRNDPEYVKIPIIVLSTENQSDEMKKAMDLGANSYLVKPFKIDLIVKEIERLLVE
ncbi:MAG: response regulator [Candidatus Delongbacteria bacterium]|nr:response regulator [Candidatus Delongbacteria bacterium]